MTAEEFKNSVEKISKNKDIEERHMKFDDLMERLLSSLGYEEGIRLMRLSPRWYA